MRSMTAHNANMSTEAVWAQFGHALKHFIAHRINDPDTVEDLLQDVFIKIHGGLGKIRDETRLQAWLYRITRNTVTDHYRRSNGAANGDPDLAESPGEEEPNAEQRLAASLESMILQLPDIYRDALYFTEIRGMKQSELAELLGISLSGAKSRVQRGRKLLRDLLMRCCHFEFDRRGTIIDYHPIDCCCCHGSGSGPAAC